MKKIPEEVRQAIRDLYAQGGLTYSQVAAQLGVTNNCVVETLVQKRTMTLEDRFWQFVDKSAGPDACWPWVGSLRPSGYGQLYVGEFKRPVAASRVSMKIHTGEWPIEACHKCDNPPCVNPAHLFNGTRKDNMQDCSAKGRVRLPNLKGTQVHNCKLTTDDVFHIRTLFHLCKIQDLAKAFGVSRSHIGNVYTGRDRKDG